MLFNLSNRFIALVSVLAIALTITSPPTVAQAHHPDPPFEMRFPQETDMTSFHNDWGARRSGGRSHSATDLMAVSKMTEVYTIADGVVVKVNSSSRAGRYLIIEHADGWESYYIHLNNDNIDTDDGNASWSLTLAPGIEEGAEVKAGQLIAWAGDSGNAEGNSPHTHFELHFDGRAMNPYPYLEAAFERDYAAYLRTIQMFLNQMDGENQIV
jgi:murein DD-endopeptidase MepM/ murein hydrolase activator NlpD